MKPRAFFDWPFDWPVEITALPRDENLVDYLEEKFFQAGEEMSHRNERAHLARASALGEIDLAELEALETHNED